MTREFVDLLGWVVLGSSMGAASIKTFLVYQAWRLYRESLSLPDNSPERIVATDLLIDASGRLLNVLLLLSLGVVWVMAVEAAAPTRTNPSGVTFLGVMIAFVVVGMAVLATLQGIRALVTAQRLKEALSMQRTPCADTTYGGCPHLSDERRAVLETQTQEQMKRMAAVEQELAELREIANKHHGTS